MRKRKIIKNMLKVSAIIWVIYTILISLICLFPKFFLQFVVGNILLDEATQNLYHIGEIVLTSIIFFLCYFLTRKQITSAADKPTPLGILNIIMALLNGFILPFSFTLINNFLLLKSPEAHACFVGIEKIIDLFNPLFFASITLFLCAYVVYWVEVICNKKVGE